MGEERRPKLARVWDPAFAAYDFGPGHPFQAKYRGLAAHLLDAIAPAETVLAIDSVPVAPDGELARFHTAAYRDRVAEASEALRPPLLDAGDTPGFPGCFEAAARLVGGGLAAWEALRAGTVERAFHPGGGLHHAHPDAASGFCIFNDVAVVLARALDGPDRIRRAAYLDIDAHHGDGVMYGFYGDGRLLDIDFHQDGRTLFPGTGFPPETGRGDGAGRKVNVPLAPGSGDAAFVPLFRRLVPALLEEHRPELIVLQHGMDAHRTDPLAQLGLSPASYRVALTLVREHATTHRVPLLVTGGGGYRPDSVAFGLARAGLALLDPPVLPSSGAALPPAFRAEYGRVVGLPAPGAWDRVEEPADPAPVPEAAAPLLKELETALGRRF